MSKKKIEIPRSLSPQERIFREKRWISIFCLSLIKSISVTCGGYNLFSYDDIKENKYSRSINEESEYIQIDKTFENAYNISKKWKKKHLLKIKKLKKQNKKEREFIHKDKRYFIHKDKILKMFGKIINIEPTIIDKYDEDFINVWRELTTPENKIRVYRNA